MNNHEKGAKAITEYLKLNPKERGKSVDRKEVYRIVHDIYPEISYEKNNMPPTDICWNLINGNDPKTKMLSDFQNWPHALISQGDGFILVGSDYSYEGPVYHRGWKKNFGYWKEGVFCKNEGMSGVLTEDSANVLGVKTFDKKGVDRFYEIIDYIKAQGISFEEEEDNYKKEKYWIMKSGTSVQVRDKYCHIFATKEDAETISKGTGFKYTYNPDSARECAFRELDDESLIKAIDCLKQKYGGREEYLDDSHPIEEREKHASSLSLSSLKVLSEKHSSSKPKEISVTTVQKVRDPYIAEYAKKRANGICQLCGKEAPFKNKNGEPYLESHHIVWLSDGGEDSAENTVALCPNCHRKMHILNDERDIEKLKEAYI